MPLTSPSKRKRSNTASSSLTSSSSSNSNDTTDNITIWRLLLSELNLFPTSDSTKPAQQPSTAATTPAVAAPLITTDESWELITNMLTVPYHLEKFMTFGLLCCLNTFLRLLIILPFRLLIDSLSCVLFMRSQFVKPGRPTSKRHDGGKGLMFMSLVAVSCYIGLSLDMSRIYHTIKAQNSMKLYMMFGVLELSEKLVSTVGQDLLNFLFNHPHHQTTSDNNSWLVKIGFYLASLGYLVIHTVLLIYQTITLNIAANSYSNTLTTMLLSMQFSEIKSSVLKRIDKEGLFQASCADITERFQLLLMLFVIMLRNLPQFLTDLNSDSIGILPDSSMGHSSMGLIGVLIGPTVLVIGSELIVDWVKHAYLTKFNKITPHTTYSKFTQILASDIISTFKLTHNTSTSTSNNNPNSANVGLGITDTTQQRIGLPLPALVVLFIVMTWRPFHWFIYSSSSSSSSPNVTNLAIVAVILLGLIIFKVLLEVSLIRWARLHIARGKKLKDSNKLGSIYNIHGNISGGVGSMDSTAREIIHGDDDTGMVVNLPESLSEKRSRKEKKEESADHDALAKVSRFRMFSKKIW